jgi:hypothetical protein
MKRLWLAVLLLAGCGTKLIDPCAHETDACLAIHIDPSSMVSKLSQVKVDVRGGVVDFLQTVSLLDGATSAELPLAVGVVFKKLTGATAFKIVVDGVLDASVVGEASIAQTLAPAQHAAVHVQLGKLATPPPPDMTAPPTDMAGTHDAAIADMTAPPDLRSSDLSNYVALTVQLVGSGSGTVSGAGLSCSGSTCTGLYAPGTPLTLAAAPATNASFTGWSGGGCAGTTLSCNTTISVTTSVTATFDWKFVPSHVPATALMTNAANLSGVTAIDTHNLTINGAAPISGIKFQPINGIAVLSVAQWNVDKGVAVTGDAPLAVIASGPVKMTGAITASAAGSAAGPGGNAICATGGGAAGQPFDAVGGGGGNFGGGASDGSSGSTTVKTPAGTTYGTKVTDFCGGSPGGDGSHVNMGGDGVCQSAGAGGGGGGVVQISSAVSITMQDAYVGAGGGGGQKLCTDTQTSPPGSSTASPGGGGSGGLIFLEAPMISIASTGGLGLFANGGGGGGGFDSNGFDAYNSNIAAGGGGGKGYVGGNGAYSADGVTLTPATPTNGGGGGGGVGRIWLHTHITPPTITNVVMSPAPTIDTSL